MDLKLNLWLITISLILSKLWQIANIKTHDIKNSSEACKNRFHDFWAVHMLKICIKLWRALRTKGRFFQFLCFLGLDPQNVGTAWNSKFTSCRITLKAPEGSSWRGALRVILLVLLESFNDCSTKHKEFGERIVNTVILKENPAG